MIFKEKSQKAHTFRPWFIANCNEANENVQIIAEMFENEILACTNMEIEFNDKNYAVQLRTYIMMDSKLIDIGTGLGRYLLLICKMRQLKLNSTNYYQNRWCILFMLQGFRAGGCDS